MFADAAVVKSEGLINALWWDESVVAVQLMVVLFVVVPGAADVSIAGGDVVQQVQQPLHPLTYPPIIKH